VSKPKFLTFMHVKNDSKNLYRNGFLFDDVSGSEYFDFEYCLVACSYFASSASWLTLYLGIFITRARTFRCSLNYAKHFLWCGNGLFGKLLNLASETAILELVRSKCMPILLYGPESCQLSDADLRSLDFTFNRLWNCYLRQRALMLLKLANLSLAWRSLVLFIKKENRWFILRFNCVENTFCNFCSSI